MNQLRSNQGKRNITSVTLDRALLARLDAWRAAFVAGNLPLVIRPPSRSAVIAAALRQFLADESNSLTIATLFGSDDAE